MAKSTATLALTDFLLARIFEARAVAMGDDDPRAERDAEAKRRIVERYVEVDQEVSDLQRAWADDPSGFGERTRLLTATQESFTLEEVCIHFATIYADHPDYRDEWRP